MLEASTAESARPVRAQAGLVIVVSARPPEPQQRLAGAKTITEAGAIDPGFIDAEIIADDEPAPR
jgi:hypothetical protein